MLVIESAAFAVLEIAIGWEALVALTATPENVREEGETLTLVPVPVRLTVWGLPLALSVMVMDPVRAPVAVGVNFTLIVQTPLAAMPVPQVLV